MRTYGNLAQKRYLYLEESSPKRKTKVTGLFKEYNLPHVAALAYP